METKPTLPKRLIDYNKFPRVLNFDINKCDGYFNLIEISREEDMRNQCYKMWCVPRDVIEDSTSLFTRGDAGKIKNTLIPVVVQTNDYQTFGKGELSKAYDYVWILPPKVEQLPSGIINNFPEMVDMLGKRHTKTTIIESQREEIETQKEHMKTIQKGVDHETMSTMLKAAKRDFPIGNPSTKENKE